jgi:hypothetical protein
VNHDVGYATKSIGGGRPALMACRGSGVAPCAHVPAKSIYRPSQSVQQRVTEVQSSAGRVRSIVCHKPQPT